jgi:hypothetical protein
VNCGEIIYGGVMSDFDENMGFFTKFNPKHGKFPKLVFTF